MSERPILVVDDDRSIRETIAEVLDLEGYPVVTAANGAEALAILCDTTPAVLLLDLQMPILDGRGLARELAAQGRSVPTIVMSAAPGGRACAEEIGALDYLPKPFDFETLLAAIERVGQRQFALS